MPLPSLHAHFAGKFCPRVHVYARAARGSTRARATGLRHAKVNGVVHGHDHRLNGTKMWTWGQDLMTDWTQMQPRDDGLGSGWGGCFSEQQTGVKQTQSQQFSLAAKEVYEFTEYFHSLEGLQAAPSTLYSPDYAAATAAVEAYLDSADGVNASAFADVDGWLAGHADHRIVRADVLHVGLPWGALEVAAGATLPTSTLFVESRPLESLAWWELLEDGAFSSATLAAASPLSFATSQRWQSLILASAKAHGATWLHDLHLAVAAADASDFEAALRLTEASLALRPSALGYRNRAVLGNEHDRFEWYRRAWEAGSTHGDATGLQLRRNLASEMAEVMLAVGNATQLANFIGELVASEPAWVLEADQIVKARVAVAIASGAIEAAQAMLQNHSFPTMSPYRDDIVALWYHSWYAADEAKLGRSLTAVERRRLRLLHPPPVQTAAPHGEWPNAGAAPRRTEL